MIKEDILIKNTTREQREQIVNDALGIVDGLCDGCSQGIISMYDAYIDGLKELDEINREFNAHYEVDDKRGGNSDLTSFYILKKNFFRSSYPHTSSAISLTNFNLAHCCSSVNLLPIAQEANPHCGLK